MPEQIGIVAGSAPGAALCYQTICAAATSSEALQRSGPPGVSAMRNGPNRLQSSVSTGVVLLCSACAGASTTLAEQLSAGVWRSLVTGGTNIYDFPLTPLGQERFESFRLDQDPALRCEPPGVPRGFYHLSPIDFRFDGDELTIRYETMDVVRKVVYDGSLVWERQAASTTLIQCHF
ncbi:MAG TPA: hypothetical protein VKQ06_01875 [Gammaproteobacteria bacterium]|nr:hypothetical protein [Gammaproteobacteria bacterium]